MTPKYAFTTSPRDGPEPLMNLPPEEGVGSAGCPLLSRAMTWWSVARSCFCDRFNFQTAKSKVFETVIASEAKQSMAAAKMDCFAALAMTPTERIGR